MADDVQVRFGANTAGVEAGATEVKGSLSGIEAAAAALATQFRSLGAGAVSAMEEIAVGAKEATEQVTGMLGPIQAMRDMLGGVGEALIAAFAVHEIADFAKSMAETAEQVAHTATTFGLAADEVQRLKALAAGVGIPFEALTTAMQRSDRALTTAREGSKQTAEAFKVLGINIHEPIDQATLLQREIAGLATVEDVPTRIGLAMQLFGRNIQNIAPLIGLTKAQLDDIGDATERFGAVSDDAQQKGLALAESFNTNKIAMQGVGNVLTSALAPALTDSVRAINDLIAKFVESYKTGGDAKTILDGLATTVRLLTGAAAAAATQLADEITVVVILANAVRGLKQALDDTIGRVGDFANGILIGISPILDFGAGIRNLAHDIAGPFASAIGAVLNPLGALVGLIKQGGAALGLTGHGNPEALGSALGGLMAIKGGGGAPPDLGGGHGGRKGGGRGKSGGGGDQASAEVQAYTDEWQHAADMAVYLSGNANQNMLQDEINFWQQKLQQAKIGTDLWYAVIEKLNPLVAQQQQEMANESKRATDEMVADIIKGSNEESRALIEAAHKSAEAQKKAAEESKRAWDRSVGSIVQDFGRGLLQMAEGATSFGQLMRNIGQKILTDWVNNISKMVSSWLRGMVEHQAINASANAAMTANNQAAANANLFITLETNLKKIASDAEAAAAGAYSWAASWGGPIAGAVAAAIAFAGVMGLEGLASAAGGYDVPAGANPLTQLHAQEMVLPARIANPLRDSLAGGGPWGGGGSGGGHSFSFGDTHINGTNMGTAEVRQLLSDHRHDLAKQLFQAVREGSRAPRGLGSPFAA